MAYHTNTHTHTRARASEAFVGFVVVFARSVVEAPSAVQAVVVPVAQLAIVVHFRRPTGTERNQLQMQPSHQALLQYQALLQCESVLGRLQAVLGLTQCSRTCSRRCQTRNRRLRRTDRCDRSYTRSHCCLRCFRTQSR